jgi:hypothetical protein
VQLIIDLHEKDLKSALKIMMAESNVSSFADLARSMNMNETTLRSAINNGSLRVKDLLEAAKIMGFGVTIQSKT